MSAAFRFDKEDRQMNLLGGITGGVIGDLAEVGIGALTGGVGMAVEQAATSVLQTAVSQALTQLGQQFGLNPSEISTALSAAGLPTSGDASQQASDLAQQSGASPTEQGAAGQSAQQATDAITQMFEQGIQDSGNTSDGVAKGGKGMSVLQAIAFAMGKVMDDKLNDMASKAQQLGNSQSGSSQYGQLSSEIQADGQELGMLSSAVSNAIKSIGDAGTTLAKKD
jgi:hypothetical protein